MIKNLHTIICLLFVIIAFSSCNTNSEKKMEKDTESPTADSTLSDTLIRTTPHDSIIKNDTIVSPKVTAKVPLSVVIDNLSSNDGEIEIGVYTPQNKFPDEKDKFKKYRFKPKNLKVDIKLADLPYGEYAFAIYHDENNNGNIDKNLIGIPNEPYAFSNNYKPTIKAPTFDNCNFTYSKESNEIKISLLGKKKK